METKQAMKWLKDNGYWEAFDANVQRFVTERTKAGFRMAFNNGQGYLLWYEMMFPSLKKAIRNAFHWEFAPEGFKYWDECDRRFVEYYETTK